MLRSQMLSFGQVIILALAFVVGVVYYGRWKKQKQGSLLSGCLSVCRTSRLSLAPHTCWRFTPVVIVVEGFRAGFLF